MPRLLAPFAVLIAALSAVIWFDEPTPPTDFVFINQNEAFTLDPQRMSYIQDLRLAHALYEGLVRWDNETYEILPAAAELPDISDDRKTLTFRIRPEAQWSTGDAVTAHDFIYSWRRAMLPDTAADYSGMFFAIEGAQEFFRTRAQWLEGFTADPWSQPSETTPEVLIACILRLEGLLNADDLPSTIAKPAAENVRDIRRGLERLRSAAASGGPTIGVELVHATAVRAWFDSLQNPDIREAEAHWLWHRTKRLFNDLVGLSSPTDDTLIIQLARPVPYFLDLLCFGVFFPVHRPTVEGWPGRSTSIRWWEQGAIPIDSCRWIQLSPVTGRLEQRHGWARPDHHVGNGPYRLTRWRYKRDLRLERNERYLGDAQARLNSIAALTVTDSNTAVLAFESGRVDWLVDAGAEYQSDMLNQRARYMERHRAEIDRLTEKGYSPDEVLALLPPPERGERRTAHPRPAFGLDFYSFNCRPLLSDGRPNPFAHAGVRRAFAYAVDRREIIERVNRLGEPEMRTLVPPGSIPGYRSPDGIGFDPVRAREELAAAGWKDRNGDGLVENEQGERFPIIDLLYTTNIPRWKWMSLALKTQWESRLGVRVRLRPIETKFYKEDLKQGKFMIARGRWYGDYGDPTTFLELNRSTDGNNDRGFDSPRIDALLQQADEERDPERRFRILEECERLLFEEELPMIPICQLITVYMYDPVRTTGLSAHPRLTQYLWQVDRRDQP